MIFDRGYNKKYRGVNYQDYLEPTKFCLIVCTYQASLLTSLFFLHIVVNIFGSFGQCIHLVNSYLLCFLDKLKVKLEYSYILVVFKFKYFLHLKAYSEFNSLLNNTPYLCLRIVFLSVDFLENKVLFGGYEVHIFESLFVFKSFFVVFYMNH